MIRIHARPTTLLLTLALALAGLGCKQNLDTLSASIVVTPDTLAFGAVTVGAHAQLRVSVSNVGSAPLEVTAIKIATDPNNELALFELLATDCNDQARTGGMTLAPGECGRFTVTWTPAGAHAASGSVEIDSNDPQNGVVTLVVSGTASGPALQYCVLEADGGVDPSACSDLAATPPVVPAIEMGSATPGTAATRIVRLTNQGQTALNFSPAPALSTTSSPELALSGTVPGASLAAGATADLTVTGNPTSAGAASGALLLDTNDPAAASVSVPIAMTVPDFPSIQVTPSTLAFGSGQIGAAQTLTANVTNVGTAPLLVTDVMVASDPNNELKVAAILATDCTGAARSGGSTLAVGECAQFSTIWTPSAVHAAAGAIAVESNDPVHPTVTLPVTGSGVSALLQACVLTSAGTIDPTLCTDLGATPPTIPSVSFGTATLGASVVRVVRLINQGTAPLTFSPAPALSAGTPAAFALSGSVPSNTLAPAGTADLTVTATATTTGTLTGALAIASNDQFVPALSLPLSLTVTAFPIISVNPSAIAFGTVEIGTPQQLQISVSNIGTAPLVISSIAFPATGNPNGDLTLDDVLTTDCNNNPRTGGTTLAPGTCARFTVVWSPLANETAAGEVDIASNDPNTPLVKLPVSGNGVTPLLQICVLNAAGQVVASQCSTLSTTPHVIPSIAFGTVQPLETSAIQVQLTNQGNTPLTFSPGPSVSGSNEFALSGAVPSNALAAGASATLTVTATASQPGAASGTLTIDSNDPRAPVIPVPISLTVPGAQLCASAGTPVAFGAVSVGSTATSSFTMTNCGQTTLTVNSFTYAATSPTTTQFTLTGLPTAGSTIAVGASVPVTVTYKPTGLQNDAGKVSYSVYAGAQTLTGTVAITGQGTLTACGTAGRNPVASIAPSYSTDASGSGTFTSFNPGTTPSPVIPLDLVKLTGSATTTPGTSIASYTWSWISQPAFGSQSTLSSTSGPTTTFQPLVSGTYEVQLAVTDSTGCVSTATNVSIVVASQGAIHIELVWAQDCGDLDLHYLPPGGSMCDGNDVFYADLPGGPPPQGYNGPGFPDWGCANQSCSGQPSAEGGPYADHNYTDDASLDIDNVTGLGPENVTQKTPFNATAAEPYQVWVYYYSNHVDDGTGLPACGNTTPTVYFYVDGVYQAGWVLGTSANPIFTNHEAWWVANISVANRSTVTITEPPASDYNLYSNDYFGCGFESPDAYGYDTARAPAQKRKEPGSSELVSAPSRERREVTRVSRSR